MKTSGDRVTSTPQSQNRALRGPRVSARDQVIAKLLTNDHLNHSHPERARIELSETSASRMIPTKPAARNAASGSSHETFPKLRTGLRNAWELIRAALSEIFDESAYQRFLHRTGLRHSRESYRAFTVERDTLAATKPRCC